LAFFWNKNMDKEPRKASDVLLEMEQKIDAILGIIRAQDLSIKILSNKLNTLLQSLEKQNTETPKITVETINRPSPNPLVDPSKQIYISSEENLAVENNPQGFRRTSRPETYSGDNAHLKPVKSNIEPAEAKFPVQIPMMTNKNTPPPGRETESVVNVSQPKKVDKVKSSNDVVQNAIPVMQRVVNAQGKSLFLADVEIMDVATMETFSKTRTNGAGKWMASLPAGNYRIFIKKLEPTSKQKMESTQDIKIDSTMSRLDLDTVIIK